MISDAYRHALPDTKCYSFAPIGRNARAIYRRLDYMLVADDMLGNIKDCEYRYVPFSDHKACVVTLD